MKVVLSSLFLVLATAPGKVEADFMNLLRGNIVSQDERNLAEEFCYTVKLKKQTEQLCCTDAYESGSGFPDGTICQIGGNPNCQLLYDMTFEPGKFEGEDTFVRLTSPGGWKIDENVYDTGKEDEFEYNLTGTSQNGLPITLTGGAKEDPNKKITVIAENDSYTLSWESNFDVDLVIMKGGQSGALLYIGTGRSADDLITPENDNGENAALSHLEICFDKDDSPTSTASPTSPTSPSPTAAPVSNPTAAPNPAPVPSPTPSGISGDPHIRKWDGTQYDFHGACDLVMLKNPDFNNGQGMTVYIRTKIVRWWSYIERTVIKIGDDTLEIKGGVDDRRYWVNGEEGHTFITSRNLDFTIGGFHGRFRAINDHLIQYKLYLPDNQAIVIKSVKDLLRVDMVNCNANDFQSSIGLMGRHGDGLMIGRDNSTVFDCPNKFGQEWQVQSKEPLLFHDVDGPQHPQQCQMPDILASSTSRRRLSDTVSREAAKLACKSATADEFDNCVFDVMATGDLEMASGY